MENLKEGKVFLRILSQAVAVAKLKLNNLVATGDFERYMEKFLSSGRMRKEVAIRLLEETFVKLIEGRFKDIDAGVHVIKQGFGTLKDNVFSAHLQGDLVLTYQSDVKNKLVKLLYLGNHSNHPAYNF